MTNAEKAALRFQRQHPELSYDARNPSIPYEHGVKVCEYCHRTPRTTEDQRAWDLVWQCWLCPECIERARTAHPGDWMAVVRGGEYSLGRPDPRAAVTR